MTIINQLSATFFKSVGFKTKKQALTAIREERKKGINLSKLDIENLSAYLETFIVPNLNNIIYNELVTKMRQNREFNVKFNIMTQKPPISITNMSRDEIFNNPYFDILTGTDMLKNDDDEGIKNKTDNDYINIDKNHINIWDHIYKNAWKDKKNKFLDGKIKFFYVSASNGALEDYKKKIIKNEQEIEKYILNRINKKWSPSNKYYIETEQEINKLNNENEQIKKDIRDHLHIKNKNDKPMTFTYTQQININQPDIIDGKTLVNRILYSFGSSQVIYRILGYKILYTGKGNNILEEETINDLRAFKPHKDRKFHELTVASTGYEGLCIYETFLHVSNIVDLKYSRRKTTEYRRNLKTRLENEGEDIKKSVEDGKLVLSLSLLTKKYKNNVMLSYFGSKINKSIKYKENGEPEREIYKYEGDYPLLFENGKVLQLKENFNILMLEKYKDKLIFLYEKNEHVAPTIFKLEFEESKKQEIDNRYKDVKKGYLMRPEKAPKVNKNTIIYSYDIETYNDEKNNATPFCLCLYSENIKKTFYGVSCVVDFCKYLNEISTKTDTEKTRKKTKVPKIHIYGYNNANFDNLLIYYELHNIDKNTEYIIASNAIKYIKFNNIHFYDMCLYYGGGLSRVCKNFNIEDQKGAYPYDFVNKNNLYYKGITPDIKYWGYDKEKLTNYYFYLLMREIKTKNKNKIFDMQEYTTYYCELDCILTYKLAIRHINLSQGIINGNYYNTTECITGAGTALKIFKQVFLSCCLEQSPKEVQKRERNSYFGGRTEVFKKRFNHKLKSNKNKRDLYYVDINSAHPSGMLLDMPYKYIDTKILNGLVVDIDDICDYFLYEAEATYKGDDKYFIQNLLKREGGSIVALKETGKNHYWGIELKEAIKNGCEVKIYMIDTYENKKVFKEFADYIYNERLKIKKSNPVLAEYYKLILNSLYGKFGQNAFTSSQLCSELNDMYKLLNNETNILVNFTEIKDKLLIEYKKINQEENNIGSLVRFSSYIACTTRCKLSELMRDVGWDNVYYCDTDSVFTSKKPNDKFLDDKKLGKWKIETEGTTICEAVFIAPKIYRYETYKGKEGKASKGVSKDKLTKKDYYNLYENKPIEPQSKKMFFRSLTGIKIQDQDRTIKTVYNKRIWEGNNSKPYNNIEKYKENKI